MTRLHHYLASRLFFDLETAVWAVVLLAGLVIGYGYGWVLGV